MSTLMILYLANLKYRKRSEKHTDESKRFTLSPKYEWIVIITLVISPNTIGECNIYRGNDYAFTKKILTFKTPIFMNKLIAQICLYG